MKMNRQHVLLGVLALMGAVQLGDWLLSSLVSGPLQERRARTGQLQKDISRREKLLAEARDAGKQIQAWERRSLPGDVDVARSAYRAWLMDQIRTASLRNATVDSGAAVSRSGLYRSLPFSLRMRGTMSQFTDFVYEFSKAPHLHQLTSLSLTPIGATGQFDISVGVDTVLLSGARRTQLGSGDSGILASASRRDYEVIARENIFGVGADQVDPLRKTLITAITFSSGVPQVWITEQLTDKVLKVGPGDEFDTLALSGRILEVREMEVLIESSGDRLLVRIGQPFSEARPL